jgi:hypothetical protein
MTASFTHTLWIALPLPLRRWLLPLTGMAFVFLITYFSVNKFANSDPYLSLLVSQAILEHQTVKMDAYKDTAQPPLDIYGRDGMVVRQGEHYYYYLPMGPSVFSLPFVQVAQWFGKDMQLPADVFAVQRVLSALLSALIFGVVFKIAESYLDTLSAFVITCVSVLGSTLTSTVGTALWNMGFVVLFTSFALLLIVRYETGKSRTLHPYWLGFCLFAAYFCRPTSAVFIALVFAYLLLRHRSEFLKTAGSALFFLMLFVAHSWWEYGQPLPVYYGSVGGRVAVHAQRVPLLTALYGTTLSPGRGLFIFSPFFAWLFIIAARYGGILGRKPLVWLCLIWFALHLFITTTATRWWGGHSYGPRLLTDILPALILLTILTWREVQQQMQGRWQVWVATIYLLLGVAGIFIHSVQGLYNNQTQVWNGGVFSPNIDLYPDYLFDWRYPQFLATHDALCTRQNEFFVSRFAQYMAYELPEPYTPGNEITFTHQEKNVTFIGWGLPEQGGRWSLCPSTQLAFRLEGADPTRSYKLLLTLGSFGQQTTTVSINGTPIGTFDIHTRSDNPLTTTLNFDGALLNPHGLNTITFDIPTARTPIAELRSLRDQRLLGLSFVAFTLSESD